MYVAARIWAYLFFKAALALRLSRFSASIRILIERMISEL